VNLTLEKHNNHLVMTMSWEGSTDFLKGKLYDVSVQTLVQELDQVKGVRRMSYNIWHWDARLESQANQFITYFMLKNS
jgi:hypothetical protein